MAYELETKKLKIEGNGFGPFKKGHYAVFYIEMLHGTQKVVNALTRPYLKPDGDQPATLTVEEDGQPKIEGSKKLKIDLVTVDFDAVKDAILLGQIKEWSFGPVDQVTLDGLPLSIRDLLVAEIEQLYSGPLAKGGVGS